jgi:hypothetical protein
MKLKSLILTAVLVCATVTADEVEKPCSVITLFGGAGKADAKDTSGLSVCKGVKKTCCVDNDFKVIQANFNGPVSSGTEKSLDAVLE